MVHSLSFAVRDQHPADNSVEIWFCPTLHTELELFSIGNGAEGNSVERFLAHAIIVSPLLWLAPQVRATMHAWDVQYGDAL